MGEPNSNYQIVPMTVEDYDELTEVQLSCQNNMIAQGSSDLSIRRDEQMEDLHGEEVE